MADTAAVNASTEAPPPTLDEQMVILKTNADAFFLVTMGVFVFFMQAGFAFLEAGAVRSKNAVNILIKNMLDCLIGAMAYWSVGWGLAYGPGGNGFAGGSQFFAAFMPASKYPSWFFQFVFAAAAATIVSGSVAERVQINAYFVYSVLITGLVYPPVSHWAWSGEDEDGLGQGWLNAMGYQDFAGSGVVHLVGGVCALVACIMVGPRQGRFAPDFGPMEMPGHSVPLAALGGFILFFGFVAFNGGSQLTVSADGDADAISTAVFSTVLGASAGGLIVLIINKVSPTGGKWSFLLTLNGMLGGMVAQCAGCNVYQPWSAAVVGALGGCVYFAVHVAMVKLELDDPLDAVAVHGGAGVVGVLCAPIFAYDKGILWNSEGWGKLGVNCLGILAIFGWCGGCSLVMFGALRAAGMLRVDAETEASGNDIPKHGESAYPADAWVEMQYKKNVKEARRNSTLPPHMGLDNGAFEMRTEQQQNSAANGADAANTPNGGVDQKWRKNYVPYQEAADATA